MFVLVTRADELLQRHPIFRLPSIMGMPRTSFKASDHRIGDQPLGLLPSTLSSTTSLSKWSGCLRAMWPKVGEDTLVTDCGESGFDLNLVENSMFVLFVVYGMHIQWCKKMTETKIIQWLHNIIITATINITMHICNPLE